MEKKKKTISIDAEILFKAFNTLFSEYLEFKEVDNERKMPWDRTDIPRSYDVLNDFYIFAKTKSKYRVDDSDENLNEEK